MSNTLPKLIVILGPTASGKTGLGIDIAQKYNGEIISADSRQIYTGMDIGTAKPAELVPRKNTNGNTNPAERDTKKPRKVDYDHGARHEYTTSDGRNFDMPVFDVEGVPHYLFDVVNPDEDFTVAHFKELAEFIIDDIIARGNTPIIVGGTGFYISAVVDNLTIPQAEPDLAFRQNLELRMKNEEISTEELYAELLEKDPDAADFVESHNPRRIIRALEIMHVTGKPVSTQRGKGEKKYDVLQIGLNPEPDVLQERINTRVDAMIEDGLFKEVEQLLHTYASDLPSMSGIGYREVVDYTNGNISEKEAIDMIKLHTWQFAKRQIKWFRRDESIVWIRNVEIVHEYIKKHLATSN